MNNDVFINISNEEKNIALLKNYKNKLLELKDKVTKTYQELSESNLSGKTFDASLLANQRMLADIDARIKDLDILIIDLENVCNTYKTWSDDNKKAVSGGNNNA